MELKEIIKNRLIAVIKENNLLQQDLADLLGIKANVISYFVNGVRTPNLQQLITISQTYNVSLEYLCGLTPDKTNIENYKNMEEKIIKSREFKNIVDICRNQEELNNDAHELLDSYHQKQELTEKTQKQINNVMNIQHKFVENELRLNDEVKKLFNSTITLKPLQVGEIKHACLYYCNSK